ncbi:hypothetical protein HG535_0A04850 [Zygotorulaspora mrakii]|uniref:ATP-dependent (S)-NAD(P)H-hydrate dehydratase n=1 Tax=Zygotorulaspora mrakii TaxID=42260 RepID=A0A7H9AWS0_ZYGMR|nr:uncharacterized protein HG535_0A04850 [Zygotorulaspora mrakii]QLG70544.1 hypothetical protein HG535_0A04850 [Zygotorulaspora mrakii]
MLFKKLSHGQLLKLARQKCIPPLSPKFHKGQSGRVCVIGGCEDYTGAPFFSANACALMGCDMTHVICEKEAAPVIKSYSPNLMVHPYLRTGHLGEMDKIKTLLEKMHVLVIGPGLGRDSGMLGSVKEIIKYVLEEHQGQIPIVLDADGLYLVTYDESVRDMLVRFPQGRIILTPNVVEFQRLRKLYHDEIPEGEETGAYIARKLHCVLVEKGGKDHIFAENHMLVNECEGSNKRVGGQGDTLSGATACMLAFSRAIFDFKLCGEPDKNLDWLDYSLLSCYTASTVTRECAKQAFAAKKRAMQTTDLNERVGQVYDELFAEYNNEI